MRYSTKLSFKIAFSALMAALGAAVMMLGGTIPVMTYISPLLASIFLIPVDIEIGKKWGWMTWLVVSMLSLLLSADKEAGFFYIFVGYYPLIKVYVDRIAAKPLRILAKAGIFTAAVGAMYLILVFVLALPSVIADFEGTALVMNIVMFVLMVFIMLCFDVTAGFAAKYYEYRIRKKLRK